MVVEITDSFTGADGATPTNWVDGYTGTGASATIQSNALRLRTSGGTDWDPTYQIVRKYNPSVVDDFDEVFECWDGDANEKYVRLLYRGDTDGLGIDGYTVTLTNGNPTLDRVESYVGTTIATAAWAPPATGTHFWMRVAASGSTHKVKFWTGNLAAQPLTGGVDGTGNQISVTDSTRASGRMSLCSAIGGGSATRDFYFDSIAPAGAGGGGGSNTPPSANAGPDQTSVEPWSTVTLTGTDSDPDGTIASRTWTQTGGTTVTLNGSGASRTFEAPGSLAGETLTFQYSVTDDDNATTSDSMTVTVLYATDRCASGGVWVPMRVVHLST